jgi:hypothetical protein
MHFETIVIDELSIPLPDGRALVLSDVEIEYECGWEAGEVDWIKLRSFKPGAFGAPEHDGVTMIDNRHWLFDQIASYIQAHAENTDSVPAFKQFDPVREYGTYP